MASRLVLSLTMLSVVVSGAGCALLDPPPTAEVGDCVDMGLLEEQQEEVSSIPTLACSEEHDGQVVAAFDMRDGEFPSEQEQEDVVGDECLSGFKTFVGTAYLDSDLEISIVSPTEESWADGDREVLCFAFLVESTTTESFEGSGL